MKKIAAVLIALYFFGPALAFADTAIPTHIPTQPTMMQLLVRTAALEAQEASTNASVACAALTSTPSVQVNQPFILAWGSVGAMPLSASSTVSRWPPAGASTITQSTPGTWVYSFTFDGQNGGSTTCTARIKVVSA